MKKILDFIKYITFIIAAILVFIFKDSYNTLVIIFCILAIIIGICLICSKDSKGILINGIGIGGIISILLYRKNILILNDSITFFIGFSLCITSILALIFDIIITKYLMETHVQKVDAVLIDLIKNPNSRRDIYLPIYGYEIDGSKYQVEYYKYYKNNIPSLGTVKSLYVNPFDRLDVYFPQEKFDKIYRFSCYVVMSLVSAAVVIGLFL